MGDSKNTGRKRSSDDSEDADGKKMKNRAAASKSREKKKTETENLKKKNEELVKTNRELTSKKEELERKLRECVEEISKHRNFGCNLPKQVMDILDSEEFSSEDFRPVGTIIGTPGSFGPSPLFSATDDQDMPLVNQPTVKGLFSGNEFLAESPAPARRRTPSSRSPSRSPPAQPLMMRQSQPSTSSSRSNKSQTSLSWKPLHQKTFGDDESPHLSPVQTVPNIDAESYTSHIHRKYEGFPDISDAVQSAQTDRGISETDYVKDTNEGFSYSGMLSTSEDKKALLSTGFIPTVSVSTLSSDHSIASAKFSDSLKSTTASSVTVSMNHTAELLSQAMTNFDVGEISEDLKKEFVRLTSNPSSSIERNGREENNQVIGQSEEVAMSSEMYTNAFQEYSQPNPVQTQIPEENVSSSITYDSLLELAKHHEQNITVQIHGQEFECNYETLKVIISRLKLEQDNTNVPGQVISSESLPVDSGVNFTNSFTQESRSGIYFDALLSDPVQQPANPNTVLNQGVTHTTHQYNNTKPQQSTVAAVQYDQLPTTVQSMIREECVDSVDYSDNVQDLPSLSLTEDHTNIFEKRRRVRNYENGY